MKKESGFTLVELMVVVSITALLLAWGIPSFTTWNNKHGIESQMIQLYNDLQSGRMTGYSNKVVSGVWWGSGASIAVGAGYQIRYDNSGDPPNYSIDTLPGPIVSIATTPIKYGINVTAIPAQALNSVGFDGRGFLNTTNLAANTTSITFSVPDAVGAAMDCVAVSSTKITLGKMNTATAICQPK